MPLACDQDDVLGQRSLDGMPDRARAIRHAIEAALPEDIVLVAGKGHEDYQQIGAARLPFSDRDQVRRLIGEAA